MHSSVFLLSFHSCMQRGINNRNAICDNIKFMSLNANVFMYHICNFYVIRGELICVGKNCMGTINKM